MRSCLKINISALKKNFKSIQKRVGKSQIMAVLKANSYGLGVKNLALCYQKLGIKRIGLAEVKEAIPLTQLEIPLQIIGSIIKEEIPLAVKLNLILPITNFEIAQKISKEAQKQKKQIKVHFYIDTGMGVLGIRFEQAIKTIQKCFSLPNLEFEGIYTHFSDANTPLKSKTQLQLQRFQHILTNISYSFPLVHAANSDGINHFESCFFDLVRVGINLYGVYDHIGSRTVPLTLALSLESQLIAKRILPKGSTIGYGELYTTTKETPIGTIPLGYADGIPLNSHNKGIVLIDGIPCLIIGAVSMDYITVDLSSVPQAQVGSHVVLIGSSKSKKINVEDWAKIKNTHPYEVICSLGSRIERKLIKD